MADQATSAGGQSSIAPHPETPAAGAPASGSAPAGGASAASAAQQVPTAQLTVERREAGGDSSSPGFGARGRMRRRLRFLRKARELGYRDVGGLVFEMQRLGERRDELVAAKLATLAAIDTELRTLEDALAERRSLTILRESGIAACPRCAAIHGSEDRFCPSCGLAMESRADRPIAAVAAAAGSGGGAGFPGAGISSAGLSGAGLPGATAPATAQAPPASATPAPVPAPAPATPVTPPASSGQPAVPASAPASAVRAAGIPQAAPQPSQPGTTPGAPESATDERPTEIIRPTDEPPREGT